MEQPKKRTVSALCKSFIRVVGYTLLFGIPNNFAWAAASVLILSELVGIYEELQA